MIKENGLSALRGLDESEDGPLLLRPGPSERDEHFLNTHSTANIIGLIRLAESLVRLALLAWFVIQCLYGSLYRLLCVQSISITKKRQHIKLPRDGLVDLFVVFHGGCYRRRAAFRGKFLRLQTPCCGGHQGVKDQRQIYPYSKSSDLIWFQYRRLQNRLGIIGQA